MASTTIYPPIVKDYEPAFVAGNNAELRVYFNLSSLSGELGTFYIHASIIRKDGVLVVNKENNGTRYRATGTILNIAPTRVSTGYYYITLINDDLNSSVDDYNGWIPGWTYKIQLRISTAFCPSNKINSQEAWLQENSNLFSEWSTICFVKAINEMNVSVTSFVPNDNTYPNNSEIKFSGYILSSLPEVEEDYYSCQIKLYDVNSNLLEDSGLIYNGDPNGYFEYIIKTKLINNSRYKIELNYVTENDYVGATTNYYFTHVPAESGSGDHRYYITTIDDEDEGSPRLFNFTTISQEEDEGRVALLIYYGAEGGSNTATRFYIRRADMRDNFSTWQDIRYIKLNRGEAIDATHTSELIYDYTIESGVWYKYAVQPVVVSGGAESRLAMHDNNTPVLRDFEYSYLLGFGEQQLKLKYDNTINSYSTKVIDGQVETIGSRYPFISRNSNIYYQTFGMNGLVSYTMDEADTFLKQNSKSIYQYQYVVNLYNTYNNNHRNTYNYTYERDFRKQVMEFLYSGKPMLFKSPSEGNLIVRIKDISFTPQQSINKLIYSFSCSVVEIDDNIFENYKKYGLYIPDMQIGVMSTTPSDEN